MSDKTIFIIGAGLAGLSTGCFAQMNGYSSRIFEHHSQPGGVAAAWKRRGYLIDGGIHFLMGHRPGTALYELYRQLGILPGARCVDMTTYGRFTDEVSGRSVDITGDLHRLAADLKAQSPNDARVIDELVEGARAMQGLDMSEFGLSKPPELMNWLDSLKDMWGMRRLLKYVTGKYARPIADYVQAVHDPWLREFIKSLFLPEVPVYFVCMVLGMLADGQLGLLEGGCTDFVEAIERRYTELGGQVTYNATVEEILVQERCAVGVRLSDGSERRADVVVSAADGNSTVFKLLGGRYVNDKISRRYATWKTFRPIMMISFGVVREFPGEPSFSTLILQQPIQVHDEAIRMIFIRLFNYSARFAPPGGSVVQVEFETGWDYWHDLQRENRAEYEAEKERIAAEVLKRLEAHYPGLSQQVEVTDVATPYTFWRYTLNHNGAWEGWLPTPDAIMTPVERTLPGLANFYMAGQWVMPGGGVPPCLYSGRHVVQLLCRQDKRPFTTSAP
jgi:phytoene desaturase